MKTINDPVSVRKLLREIGIKKTNKNNSITSLKFGNNCTDISFKIATEFNKLFVSDASKLKAKVTKKLKNINIIIIFP